MAENVKIPLLLFNQTIDFLESINPDEFDPILACYYEIILYSFLQEKQNVNLCQNERI